LRAGAGQVTDCLGTVLVAALGNELERRIRSFFLGGYDPTLPALNFGRLRSGLTPEINTVATMILIINCGTGVALVWRRHISRRT
jgi:ABC-type spermidine/putrescine transport system permease subunit II